MPAPTATIGSGSPNAARMTRTMNDSQNPDFVFTGNANVARKPDYYVRIFNVGDMEHKIERPWVNYNPAQKAKIIIIPACVKGEPYSKPFVINDVVQTPIRNILTNEMDTRGVDGKFLAQDALNPEDPRGSWKTVRQMNPTQLMNEGTNLYNWGCFWTLNEVPSEEELQAASEKRDAYYNHLIEEAKALWMGGDSGKKQIGFTHRKAASYFGLEFEWNQLYKATSNCDECDSVIPVKASVCPKCGNVRNWEQAIARGLKTPEQASLAGISLKAKKA